MNFQYLEQNSGNNHDLSCVVIGVEDTKYTDKGKPYNKCTLQDATGRSETLKVFQGNNPPLSRANIGQSLIFKLKHGVYNGRPYFNGFWQCPNPQQTPQNVPQAPISPPPVPNYPQSNMPVSDETRQQYEQGIRKADEWTKDHMRYPDTYAYPPTPESQARMIRCIASQCACQIMTGRQSENLEYDVWNWTTKFQDFIDTGQIPTPEPEQDDKPSFF